MPSIVICELGSIRNLGDILGVAGEQEKQLITDPHRFDRHLTASINGRVVGWAGLSDALGRFSVDAAVTDGDHEDKVLAALIRHAAGKAAPGTTFDWWVREHTAEVARHVAQQLGAPLHRQVMRMGRTVRETAGDAAATDEDITPFAERFAAETVRVNNAAFWEHPDRSDMTVERLIDEIERVGGPQENLLLSVDDDGTTVHGFVWVRPVDNNTGEVYVLAVDPAYQGYGYGKALFEAGIAALRSRYGHERVVLYVNPNDAPAMRLYSKRGFMQEPDKTLSSYSSNPDIAEVAQAPSL